MLVWVEAVLVGRNSYKVCEVELMDKVYVIRRLRVESINIKITSNDMTIMSFYL